MTVAAADTPDCCRSCSSTHTPSPHSVSQPSHQVKRGLNTQKVLLVTFLLPGCVIYGLFSPFYATSSGKSLRSVLPFSPESETRAGKCCRLLPFELIWAFVAGNTRYFYPHGIQNITFFIWILLGNKQKILLLVFVFFCPKLNALFPHVSAFEAR